MPKPVVLFALGAALAAWLPVLSFGPLAFVLFDAVHT